MEAKQKKRLTLARFCGLKRYSEHPESPWMLHGIFLCRYADWNPAKKPEQWAMVLEALVENLVQSGHSSKPSVWRDLLERLGHRAWEIDDFDLGQAICNAATEAMKAKGKNGE